MRSEMAGSPAPTRKEAPGRIHHLASEWEGPAATAAAERIPIPVGLGGKSEVPGPDCPGVVVADRSEVSSGLKVVAVSRPGELPRAFIFFINKSTWQVDLS